MFLYLNLKAPRNKTWLLSQPRSHFHRGRRRRLPLVLQSEGEREVERSTVAADSAMGEEAPTPLNDERYQQQFVKL